MVYDRIGFVEIVSMFRVEKMMFMCEKKTDKRKLFVDRSVFFWYTSTLLY